MKKILILLLGINLFALDFGKDVDIVGKWYIRSVDDLSFAFASGAGNKWTLNFRPDGTIYDILKDREVKKQLNWQYSKEPGVVSIKFQLEVENKQFVEAMLGSIMNDDIKIKEKLNLVENRDCYLVNIINKERDIYMCEILDKKESQRRERERAKRAIKIN
jgi:hypothetical protein